MKKYITGIVIIVIIGIAGWYYIDTQRAAQTGEEVAVEQSTLTDADVATLSELIVGTWRSTDDASSEVLFNADGTTIDMYEGEEVAQGTWNLALGAGTEYQDTGIVLTTTIDGQEYRYLVWDLNATNLVLNYVERGNTLSYTRVSGQ